MRNRVNQIYENYWNYTAAFTDFNGTKFRNSLKTIVEYLDAHDGSYTQRLYDELQNNLQDKAPHHNQD